MSRTLRRFDTSFFEKASGQLKREQGKITAASRSLSNNNDDDGFNDNNGFNDNYNDGINNDDTGSRGRTRGAKNWASSK